MKNILLIGMIGAFLFFAPEQTFAQAHGQEKREAAKENQDKAQEKREEAKKKRDKAQDNREKAKDSRERQDKLSKDNQGPAYGRDKGDMTGREFGQHRAEMARNKVEHANTRIMETENLIFSQRERLRTLKQSAEEEAKRPNADKKAIEEREIRIRHAEERLSQLEDALKESRERLRTAEHSLRTVIEDN